MLKSIILFFRKKNIRKNTQNARLMRFPDFDKFPIITLFIDDNQKKDIKAMEHLLKESLKPRNIRFIVLTESVKDDFLQSEYMVFIEEKDFNKLGLLKKEKQDTINMFADDMLINLSDNNENLLNDYLVSCLRSPFKVGHSDVNMKIHDLVLDYGIEKNDVQRLKILNRYLMMLSGNKHED
ncbi:MAG: hypothetical protein IJZ06_09595 [Bacteroidales bacterium]|nr:hypothetical protein [Bacteroidales bacterium]